MYINEKLMIALRNHMADDFLKENKQEGYFREQELAKIKLPTGKIVANDPLVLGEMEAFTIRVPSGEYPVVLYIYHNNDDQRVAFAEMRLNEKIPVRFEPALVEGQEAEALEEDEFFGYGVDTGTGCFMDEQTCKKLEALMDTTEYGELTEFDKLLEESYVDTYMTANFVLPETDFNVVAFSSGYGDGCYPSFWGYDASGELCCLITDFCVIDMDDNE